MAASASFDTRRFGHNCHAGSVRNQTRRDSKWAPKLQQRPRLHHTHTGDCGERFERGTTPRLHPIACGCGHISE
eukprot:NODE_19748_length_829_cov_3.153846.p4 GENE.NODE_19748_length_829_cov_3.153846~~NODE_19748_length_829_cov_3.153846.p4  ORF type:complete len:74 (+),score=4.98 NODE_19748_length_829_cov_3.153846:456-677(+)